MKEERKTHPAFKMVGPSLATKGNGTRIFAKLFLDGRWTWRTTKTDKLELARKWKENWDENRRIQKLVHVAEDSSMTACLQNQKTNGHDNTLGSEQENSSKPPPLIVDQILDNYVAAGQPTVKKRKLKPKSPTSIRNEQYSLHPLRIYFGRTIGDRLTLADCDGYHAWRNRGGYVSKFNLRGHQIEQRTRGGNRVVDLNLVVLSNALELAIRQGYLTSNPIKDRGRYSDDADVRHCREVAPTSISIAHSLSAWVNSRKRSHVRWIVGAMETSRHARPRLFVIWDVFIRLKGGRKLGLPCGGRQGELLHQECF